MKKKEFLDFYKTRFKAKNHGRGEWEFVIKEEGKAGYLKIMPSLLKSPPIQRIDSGASMSPSWYAELLHEINGHTELDFLFLMGDERMLMPKGEKWFVKELIPEEGEIFEEHLEDNLKEVLAWYEFVQQPDIIAADLAFHYALGDCVNNAGFGGAQTKFCYANVLKGNVELLQAERDAMANGTSPLPPAFTLEFFENCVRIAKEYRSGARVCPIDF